MMPVRRWEDTLFGRCSAAGITCQTYHRRRKLGMTDEQALSKPAYSKDTISSKAYAAGLIPQTVYSRLKQGWTLERALSTPRLRKRRTT